MKVKVHMNIMRVATQPCKANKQEWQVKSETYIVSVFVKDCSKCDLANGKIRNIQKRARKNQK
jgi:hypothetical protein